MEEVPWLIPKVGEEMQGMPPKHFYICSQEVKSEPQPKAILN